MSVESRQAGGPVRRYDPPVTDRRAVEVVDHRPSRLAAVTAAYTLVHGIVVLGLLALLAATAAVNGHVTWRLPEWLADVAAPWVTALLVGVGVLPVLGIAALVQVREVRRGVVSSPALVLSWLPSLVSAAVLVVVARGLGWAPAAWLAGECAGVGLTGADRAQRRGGER